MKVHNFSAGPCILPQEVFENTANAVRNLNDSGLSVLEISHRSKDAVEILDQATSLVKELMNVPDTHEVVFVQGGASLQFVMIPFNLMLAESGTGLYLDTGSWSSKAIKEAKNFGKAEVIGSSKDKNYNYIPKDYTVPSGADYFHCTSNNTIFGTQMKSFPKTDTLLVCDMSSDILSRVINVSEFDLIYAGAQKNMGPAGVTCAIIRKDILGKTGRSIPSYLNYQTHIDKGSAFNTWPVISVYALKENLQWLKNQGGVATIEKVNQEKADLLYNEIDRSPLFEGTAEKEDRSNMNATFVLTNEAHKEAFDKLIAEANIKNLNGHRSVGGYRASMYNALPISSVEVLVETMKALENNV